MTDKVPDVQLTVCPLTICPAHRRLNPCQKPGTGARLKCQLVWHGTTVVPCRGKRHRCQLLGTDLAPVPANVHSRRGGGVSVVLQGVVTATVTGTPTLHPGASNLAHRSTAQVPTSLARDTVGSSPP